MALRIEDTRRAAIKEVATAKFEEEWLKILVYTYDYEEKADGSFGPEDEPKDAIPAEYTDTIKNLSDTTMNAVIDSIVDAINAVLPVSTG